MKLPTKLVQIFQQEVNDQTLVGKKADLAMFGVSVISAVRALSLSAHHIDYIIQKRRGKLRHENSSSEILVVLDY